MPGAHGAVAAGYPRQPMRVLLAPDSFSGTLTAVEAAAAMATGWRRARPGDEILQRPMSDGGEGLLDVVAVAHPGAVRHEVEVADARGIARTAAWLEMADGTAVVEVAEAVGLHDLAAEQRDPLRATTYGVGQLLLAVAATDPARIVVGLGGSATVDGGAGMVSAMTGHALRRADGNGVKIGGRWVAEAASMRPAAIPNLPPVVIASDVVNPLLGPRGAATVFGPQKGASPDGVRELEAALTTFADVIERDLPGGPWRDRPGAGAAGGLGFALMALLGADTTPGAAVVADLIGLNTVGADVVVTGEGRLDGQTAEGKAPAFVAARARQGGARVGVIAGQIAEGAAAGFDMAEALGPNGLRDAHGAVSEAAARLAERV